MARTAAKRAQPRTGGEKRKRLSTVDSRQMDFFAARSSTPAPTKFPSDLFEFAQGRDAQAISDARPISANTPKVEAPPAAADDDDDNGEAQTLAAIADLIHALWRETTGEDLSGSSPGPQNSYCGKASIARVSAGQPASPSSA